MTAPTEYRVETEFGGRAVIYDTTTDPRTVIGYVHTQSEADGSELHEGRGLGEHLGIKTGWKSTEDEAVEAFIALLG